MPRLFTRLVCICISLPLLTCTPLTVPLDNIPQSTTSAKAPASQTGELKFTVIHPIQPPQDQRTGVDMYSILTMRDAINAHHEPHVELVGEVGGLSLADEQLAEIPVILLTYAPPENEWEPLCRYLLSGGFLLAPREEPGP
ncbi:MAG: hypothetical protein EXS58_11685 [Candidatus Latescibacteria bacterium]|nr:hypothetical protein [Candidatus Latescibacterota bacterium]